jgi:GT2 family glycosyltransferase
MMPRILVSTPTYAFHAYCLDRYVEHLRAIDYPRFDILLVDNSEDAEYLHKLRSHGVAALHVEREAQARATLVKSRNLIRAIVLSCGYDYLLFLDQDVFPPCDVLSRLVQHRQPVVSGVYTKWALGRRWAVAALREWRPTRWSEHTGGTTPAGMVPLEELPQERLVPIYGAGHGCLLIARDVLHKIRFRYDPTYDNDSDVYFAADVCAAGFPFYLDASVRCRHFSVAKDYVTWKGNGRW